MRKPFQGVFNIVRFNWHLYLIAAFLLFGSGFIMSQFPDQVRSVLQMFIAFLVLSMIISLLVSYYVYDFSDLYQFRWLDQFIGDDPLKTLNVNAGFDETSDILEQKIGGGDLTICDFYDPEKHTEISIQRARKAYPPNPKTITIKTHELPFPDNNFHQAFAVLSAHEIRNEQERIIFFKELHRVTQASGLIFVTEHLRDYKNFLAYTVGFLHFHSRRSWLRTFKAANLTVKQEVKTTPFITTFILEKHGNPL